MGRAVTVTSEDGEINTCYQNKYGMNPSSDYGAAYPATLFTINLGYTRGNDVCMGVGVFKRTNYILNGWNCPNGFGYDCPRDNNEWPNPDYGYNCFLSVWIK